jgi:sulfonate transport system permease protein
MVAGALWNSGVLLPLFILFLWWWGSRSGWWSAFLLPGPSRVLRTFFSLTASGELLAHTWASLLRIVKGFSASAIFALALAFASGLCAPLLRQTAPLLELLRHIPPMATIPMLILWFGIGEASKLVIIVMATFFPIYLNTVQGISQCDPKLIEVARGFGYSRLQTLRHVVLPSALPYIFTGMRLGLGYSWRSLIAAELVAASSGLGYMILDAEQLSRPDVILVGILVIGFLGSFIDLAFSAAARRLAPYGSVSSGVA